MTSIEPSDTNTLVIVDAANSSGSGDLFNQEVTVLGNTITISSGTDATYGTHLDIRFTGSGNMEKLLDDAVTSVTVDTQAMGSDKYVVMTVLDPSQTQVIAKKQIGRTDFPQKAVMQFSSGVGQTLRIEAVDGFDLYNIYADAGIAILPPIQYLGIHVTNGGSNGTIISELLLDYNGGKLGHTSGGGDLSIINDDISKVKNIVPSNNYNPAVLFDSARTYANPGGVIFGPGFGGGSKTGMLISIEIPGNITITGGKMWGWTSGAEYGSSGYKLYTTRTNPEDMADPQVLSNWEHVVDLTGLLNSSAYP